MRLAFIGPQGSGKTAMAQSVDAERLSFATRLREEVAIAASLDADGNFVWADVDRLVAEMQDRATKETWRPVLQAWGKMRRDRFGEDYWVKQLEKDINACEELAQNSILRDLGIAPHYEVITVDDTRYPNEYNMLKRRGFKFVRLGLSLEAGGAAGGHESEQFWPNFKYDLFLPWQDEQSARVAALKAWCCNVTV